MKILKINPELAAKYEVNWWKAHHYGDKISLIVNLVRHNQVLYEINIMKAISLVLILVPAAKAHNQKDEQTALIHMTKYYEHVKKYLKSEMVAESVAKAEVQSWWVHDDLDKSPNKNELTKSFQKLYSGLLGLSEDKVIKLSKLKTVANTNHDMAESTNDKVLEIEYWRNTESSLKEFYKELNLLMKTT